MRLFLIAVFIALVLSGLSPAGYALSPEYKLDAALSSADSRNAYAITQSEWFTPRFEHAELRLSSDSSVPFLDVDPLNEKVSIALPATPLLVDKIGNLDLQVPMVRTAKIDRHVQFFSYQIRDRFEQWLSRLERYRPSVQSVFSEFKLPVDLIFLSLVESGFNTNAVSRAKAVGPWQFMKPTAKFYGLRVDEWVDERRDPAKSTLAAAQYLRDLYHLFGSWPLAMAAYNAGEGKVGRSMARLKDKDSDFWALTDTKLLKAETREYVPRFAAAVQIAKDPARFGFNIAPQPPVEFEEMVITRPVHLKAAAQAAGVSLQEMKNLNPELKREMTPPDPMYVLKIPVGKKDTMIANLPVYRTLYPAVYLEPKRKLFVGLGKEKLGLSHLAARARHHKSRQWLLKDKSARGKSPVVAQVPQ